MSKSIYTQQLHNKNVLVVGLAKTGVSAAQFLISKGAFVTAADINSNNEKVQANAKILQEMGASLAIGHHDPQIFTNADVIVLSPGVPHTITPIQLAREKNIPIIGETELAFQFIKQPIVAITGTNGKTTTVELTGEMLRKSNKQVFVGGNIGTPLTDLLNNKLSVDIIVLEVSSFQLDTIDTFCPDVAVLLNITEDHLYRYPDMTAYRESKFNIFKNQQSSHTAILNGQDPYCVFQASAIQSNMIWLDRETPKNGEISVSTQSNILKTPFQSTFDLTQTRLIGNHNRQNIAAAVLSSQITGGTIEGIQSAINTFKGLPHRVEYVATIKDISFYNDSKATNVDATIKALQCFDVPVHLILGGQDKGGDYACLVPFILQTVCECILMGEAQPIIQKSLDSHREISHIPIYTVKSLEQAVEHVMLHAVSGDVVLLSPACASFDMFDSYNHRGETFKAIVHEKQFSEKK